MYNQRRKPKTSIFHTAGWLFADLFLALTIIFLSANALASKPKVAVTPTVKPTATPLPSLESGKQSFGLTIDPDGILANSQNAINSLEHEIQSQKILHGRTAGLVIVSGGALGPNIDQITRAKNIALKVMDILRTLGRRGFAFTRTSYYDPLFLLYNTDTMTYIDVYLFKR
jgi:hypothetical protein